MERRGMKGAQGFSLLELAVATLLLGVASVGLLGLIGDSLGAIQDAREFERTAGLARGTMNEILTRYPLPVGGELRGTYHNGAEWAARADPVEKVDHTPAGSELLRVRLDVWWDSRYGRRALALETLRRSEGR